MSINTIGSTGKGEYKSRGSKFFAFTHKIDAIENYRDLISFYRSEYPDACHVCSAYRLMVNSRLDEQASDDGEPKGSSGTPILNQLKRNDLVNSATFVVRVFGGTLLGIPGLVDAYSNAALISIDNAKHVPWRKMKNLYFTFDYELKGVIDSVIKEFKAEIIDQKFLADVSITISISKDNSETFVDRINELTSARVKFSS